MIKNSFPSSLETDVQYKNGMLYMSSSSNNNGGYSLIITFEIGTDINIATVWIQKRVEEK